MKLIESESDYFHDDQEIITLENCSCGGIYCHKQMVEINTCLLQSRNFFIDKDFIRAIEMKKLAFDETFDFKEETCGACGVIIREFIYNSAKDMLKELEKMTRGWFRNKRYIPQYEKARMIVNEMAAIMNEKDNS